MTPRRGSVVRNGKVPIGRVRFLKNTVDDARPRRATSVRLSHSLSPSLASRLRKLAFEQKTSESSILECALWLFFAKGSDADVLGLMRRADIEPRRRRS